MKTMQDYQNLFRKLFATDMWYKLDNGESYIKRGFIIDIFQ
jgi:hypothetical protein